MTFLADLKFAFRALSHAKGLSLTVGRADAGPYTLVPTIARLVREIAVDQPVERASTRDDVRAEVLAPTRLNTLVFGGFAAVALAISIVGVAGVLAFSVSGRTREFGIRLALGSQSGHLLTRVLFEGALMAALGVILGASAGLVLTRVAGVYIRDVQLHVLCRSLARRSSSSRRRSVRL